MRRNAVLAACGRVVVCHGGVRRRGADPDRRDDRPRAVAARAYDEHVPRCILRPRSVGTMVRRPSRRPGLAVRPFAAGLDHPRWLYVLPNGDVLVAETNAPERPDDGKGIKGWVMEQVMKTRGRGGAERRTASRCCATPTATASPRSRMPFLEGLHSPFGMALVGSDLYVANTDALRALSLHDGRDAAHRAPAQTVVDLPGGPLNHHWTKNVIASPRRLAALRDRRLEQQRRRERHRRRKMHRAAILEIDPKTEQMRVFASGLAQSERPGVAAARPARSGRWSTSATSSAAISCRTT